MIFQPLQLEKNINWLLANGSAAIKYLTHKNILKTPKTSKIMQDLWRNVEKSSCVQEIFGKQEKDGSWNSGGTWANNPSYAIKGGIDPYRPKYVTTTWILPLLGEMGFTVRDKRIQKACKYILSNGYYQNPIFNHDVNEICDCQTDLSPCRFAQYMLALGTVGFTDDDKVEKGYKFLLSMQQEDGGWVYPKHAIQMKWTRSCPFSTYHSVMALYYSNNPAYNNALVKGAKFLMRHLATKKETELQQFYFHGHSMVRELVMYSDLGIGLQSNTIKTVLDWLMTMYVNENGFFSYNGKPISKFSRTIDGIDSAVAKYRLYHIIEDDWFTYHMCLIAINQAKHVKSGH